MSSPNSASRERVRRARIWAEFREARVRRDIARRVAAATVEQPGEAWPIVERTPEHEPDIPPDLSTIGPVLGRVELRAALARGDIDAIRRHNRARSWLRVPLEQVHYDASSPSPLADLHTGFAAEGALTVQQGRRVKEASRPNDPLFPLGRVHKWDRVVLYNSATEMDIRRMQNAEVIVTAHGTIMKDARGGGPRWATDEELRAVGLFTLLAERRRAA